MRKIIKHMENSLPHDYILLGFGKYIERYRYLEQNLRDFDLVKMKKLWGEIKNKQNERGFYLSIEQLDSKLKPIGVWKDDKIDVLKTSNNIYNRYAKKFLIKAYPDKGLYFINNELEEYKNSKDLIELFDAYFMFILYVLAKKIDNKNINQILDKFNEIIKEFSLESEFF